MGAGTKAVLNLVYKDTGRPVAAKKLSVLRAGEQRVLLALKKKKNKSLLSGPQPDVDLVPAETRKG